ncbi:MAG: cytochrome C [Sulfurovum sp.]|nr:MAG: cytochrome C [Sulfurovum sp.]
MKKLLVGCVAVVTFAFAESNIAFSESNITCAKNYTCGDRISDMQRMGQAMQDMQSGFFYNNFDIVKAGAEDLKKTIVEVSPIKEEVENTDVYEIWLANNTAMKKRIQRRIVQYSEDIISRFGDGDVIQAIQVYNKITLECMKCHVGLRKW